MTEAQDVVDDVAALLGAPATLEDRHFGLQAASAHSAPADRVRLSTILARASGPEVRSWFESFGISHAEGPVWIPADEERGIGARLCLPARFGGVVQGYLWVVAGARGLPRPGDHRLAEAEELAAAAGDLLARRSRQRRVQTRQVHELLEAPMPATVPARALARSSGLPLESPVVVAVLAPTRPEGEIGPERLQGRGVGLRGLVLAADGSRCVVLGEPARVELALPGLTALVPDVLTGVGGVVPRLAEAARSWQEALRALEVMAVSPAYAPIAHWDALGLARLLATPDAADMVEAVRTPAVRALLDSGRTELIETARVYLDQAGSVADTAMALGLHRQTVYYRLDQITALTGLDLRDGRARLELHLGLILGG